MLGKLKIFFFILLITGIGYGIYFLDGALPIGTGYSAKYICSQVFLAGRDPDLVFDQEVKPTHPLFRLVKISVDENKRQVTASAFGFWKTMTAVFRDECGCTLAVDTSREELLSQAEDIQPQKKERSDDVWPYGKKVDLTDLSDNIDQVKLKKAMEDAFKEPGPDTKRNTQAIVVVLGDQIIAEKYDEGFDENTPMLGWSMSKSVTNAFVGILVKEGILDIMQPAPVAAWNKKTDPRGKITLDMLLRMSSGLEFEETYGPFKDATYMLYTSKSMAEYAQTKPLQTALDEKWSYSSGTTNIIARIVRDKTGGTLASTKNYFNKGLFNKLGMVSAVVEADSSGSFVGSSYMFATARDWARFGLFIKNDGVWKGERILPEGWVAYSTTPTPKAPMGKYGAQFWLNAGDKENPTNRTYPSLPADLAYLSGFNDQVVAIIPSKDLVVVRLGVTHDNSWSNETFVKNVIDAIDE